MRIPDGHDARGPSAPARASSSGGGVSGDRSAIFRLPMRKPPEVPAHEAAHDSLPNLSMPSARRRYLGFGLSVALHAALLALIVLQGDRLWRRSLAPGAPALFLYQGGGGGGGGNRSAYITLPSPPEREPQPPAPAPPPPPVVIPADVPPPVEAVAIVPPAAAVDSAPAVA